MKKEEPLKSLKIPESTHRKMKVHVARCGENIATFAAAAIEEKIKKEKSKQ